MDAFFRLIAAMVGSKAINEVFFTKKKKCFIKNHVACQVITIIPLYIIILIILLLFLEKKK